MASSHDEKQKPEQEDFLEFYCTTRNTCATRLGKRSNHRFGHQMVEEGSVDEMSMFKKGKHSPNRGSGGPAENDGVSNMDAIAARMLHVAARLRGLAKLRGTKRPVKVVAILSALGLTVLALGAWTYCVPKKVTATCVSGSPTVSATFQNTEKDTYKTNNDMEVTATAMGQSQGPVLVKAGESHTFTFKATGSSIQDGKVVYKMTWANGRSGTDTGSTSYSGVTCTPPVTPTGTVTGSVVCSSAVAAGYSQVALVGKTTDVANGSYLLQVTGQGVNGTTSVQDQNGAFAATDTADRGSFVVGSTYFWTLNDQGGNQLLSGHFTATGNCAPPAQPSGSGTVALVCSSLAQNGEYYQITINGKWSNLPDNQQYVVSVNGNNGNTIAETPATSTDGHGNLVINGTYDEFLSRGFTPGQFNLFVLVAGANTPTLSQPVTIAAPDCQPQSTTTPTGGNTTTPAPTPSTTTTTSGGGHMQGGSVPPAAKTTAAIGTGVSATRTTAGQNTPGQVVTGVSSRPSGNAALLWLGVGLLCAAALVGVGGVASRRRRDDAA